MKKLLIAANWKSNKTKNEARNWIFELSRQIFPENLEIVIFPPLTLLDFLDSFIKANDLHFKLGAQNISPFEQGSYTGEVSADQIKEFANYSLIGHSERRENFAEDEALINRKIEQAISQSLTPIVCISNLGQVRNLSSGRIVIAYEPLDAIGSGKPEDPRSVFNTINQIKQVRNVKVLYGGSVDSSNIKNYTSQENISGVLVGGQSLEAESFINLLNNAF
ncbi:MAG: Triosephosphate isomerase [Microgenomates group bacterium GW2011_GWA2_37_6]|nr:MAG: Triosephosphate isomerase [Microgenomates group bacterium GW2011_GWA2_37_6]